MTASTNRSETLHKMNTKTDIIQTLLDNGYTEDRRLAVQYERQFFLISFCGILLIFYPAIGVLLDNFFLLIFYGITGPLLGLIFIFINIYLIHTNAPVSPSTGKKMEKQTISYQFGSGVIKTYDVWICHDSKTFCKRLLMESGGGGDN